MRTEASRPWRAGIDNMLKAFQILHPVRDNTIGIVGIPRQDKPEIDTYEGHL